ncbi:MAG: hypothetical protein ACOCTS_03370 [Thermodesulfobacteriota bacterium]
MKIKFYQKTRLGGGTKAVQIPADGARVTDEQLARINKYALSPLTADDVYVRKYLIAHNMVDRDRERFSEELLDNFAATFPGKSFLFAHDRGDFLPLGLIFDAGTEEMSPEQFAELTGEEARLPDGIEKVKVVMAWFYIPRTETSADIIKNIEAGIYRHGSIGFGAADLAPVKGEYDQILFWEYKAPGEAREASLVWLGAQHGATTQKAAGSGGNHPEPEHNKHNKGDDNMKILKTLLGKCLGKSFGDDVTEEQMAKAVEDAISEKDQRIQTLEQEKSDMSTMAEVGKKYRKLLDDEYVRMKTALGECEETEEAAKQLKGFAAQLPIDFLENEVKALNKRMAEKFPADGQLSGDQRRDKSGDGKGAEENELIPAED